VGLRHPSRRANDVLFCGRGVIDRNYRPRVRRDCVTEPCPRLSYLRRVRGTSKAGFTPPPTAFQVLARLASTTGAQRDGLAERPRIRAERGDSRRARYRGGLPLRRAERSHPVGRPATDRHRHQSSSPAHLASRITPPWAGTPSSPVASLLSAQGRAADESPTSTSAVSKAGFDRKFQSARSSPKAKRAVACFWRGARPRITSTWRLERRALRPSADIRRTTPPSRDSHPDRRSTRNIHPTARRRRL